MEQQILKVKLLDDIDSNINDSKYFKNQVLTVVELPSFDRAYAYYYKTKQQGDLVDTFDWIPKYLCNVIE